MTAVKITGRPPDCPDCGAQMQHLPIDGVYAWRCPWVSAKHLRAVQVAGEEGLACDWPLGSRTDNIVPYGDR